MAAQAQKPSQEKEEKRKRTIANLSFLQCYSELAFMLPTLGVIGK